MTRCGAHLRSRAAAEEALGEALEQYRAIGSDGLKIDSAGDLPAAIAAEQQCLTHVALLKSICGMFEQGAGSRGSHCILADDGIEMHPALIDPATGGPYRFRQENVALRERILCTRYDPGARDLFVLRDVAPRPVPRREIAFEPAWAEFRDGRVFDA